MITALYPGTFDPVTKGHLDIIQRASEMFDKLVVAVFATPSKNLMFSTKERVELIREATAHLQNMEVVEYTGLTVFFAREVGAKVIVRGLRMVSDFEYEFQMAMMNKKLAPDVDEIFLMASLDQQFVASSLLKEVALLGGDINNLVPENVTKALNHKFRALKKS